MGPDVSRFVSKMLGAGMLIAAMGALAMPAAAQCKPGDHLIGEDTDFYYCSTRTCAQLAGQIGRDQDALKRLRESILASNAELHEWAAKNREAELKARDHATGFLVDTALGALVDLKSEQLAEVEAEFGKRLPMGTTWRMQVDRVRELRSQSARLAGTVDGLKLGRYPGLDAVDWWAEVKHWGRDVEDGAGAIRRNLDAIERDPEAAAILREHKVKFVTDGLKAALAPVIERPLSFGQFIVDYGYDVRAWFASKARIEQNVLNQDANRIAVCKLSMQLQKTVRDNNICNKKYPDSKSPEPDPAKCR